MQLTDVQTIATLLGIAVMLVGIVLTSDHRLASAFKEQTAENKTRFDRVDARLDAMNRDMNQRFDTLNRAAQPQVTNSNSQKRQAVGGVSI